LDTQTGIFMDIELGCIVVKVSELCFQRTRLCFRGYWDSWNGTDVKGRSPRERAEYAALHRFSLPGRRARACGKPLNINNILIMIQARSALQLLGTRGACVIEKPRRVYSPSKNQINYYLYASLLVFALPKTGISYKTSQVRSPTARRRADQ
jgi:hypothetical protein